MIEYLQAKSVSEDFIYDDYRQKKIREKINEQIASRVKTKVLLIYFIICICMLYCTFWGLLELCLFGSLN